jgi:serine/threonine protein phosphatase PrpC
VTGAAPARQCPSCSRPVGPGDNFCGSCRASLPGGAAGDHRELDAGLVAGVTDLGLRHHRNEDAMALAAVYSAAGPVAIAVVSDGVSTSARPDEASRAAVGAAISVLDAAVRAGRDPEAASADAIRAAQDAVAGFSAHGTGTATGDAPAATYVSAVISAGVVTVCWLGDSRAYWLESGPASGARQLTVDDSVATVLVAAGATPEEALRSPQAHVLTGWLGADSGAVSPHAISFRPAGPGVVLLCSDGLWNYEPEAARLAERALPGAAGDPLGTARALVEFAIAEGGADNITVVIAPYPPASGPGPGQAATVPARTVQAASPHAATVPATVVPPG